MLKNFLKISLRNLKKYKLVSFINIFGLGLAMSVGMMIVIRTQDQLSYDNFHPDPDHTFRILSDFKKKTGEQWSMASTPLPLSEKIKSGFSGIADVVYIYPAFNGKAIADGKEIILNGCFTDPAFFRVFGFTLLYGDGKTALDEPNSIVISKQTSEKYFGTENPVGKIFLMEKNETYKITGVLNEAPSKSHISFDAFVSISTVPYLEKSNRLPAVSTNWFAFNAGYTYVRIKEPVKSSILEKQMALVSADLNKENKEGYATFKVQSLQSVTPGTDRLQNDIGKGSSWSKLFFEIAVALLILIAACFNYTNLNIARALTRAKEVGVRKVAGAHRYQIFIQYIVESVLVAILALGFAAILLSFILRYAPFNDGYEFIPSSFKPGLSFYMLCFAYTLLTGILAGAVPAWILSSFKPLRVLKNLVTARIVGKISLQKSLIVFQYSLSLVIIIFLFAFYRQFAFLAKVDPGFSKDNLMVVALNGLDEQIASQKIAQLNGVNTVSAMSSSLNKRFDGMTTSAWVDDKTNAIGMYYYFANPAFVKAMDLKLIAGNGFPVGSDADNERYILLNQQAAIALGFKDFNQAIGQQIKINDSTNLEIAGILNNFNYENAGIPVRALGIRTKKNEYNYLYINAANTDKKTLTASVIQTLKTISPKQNFDISWLGDDLEKNNSQSATVSLLGYLAFMAVAIASLGLLGLVIYSVETKRKEISIRKIIGAEVSQVVKKLSTGFVKLLFIAGLIAMPVGYTASFLFLQGFANRVSFGLGSALICFLLLLIIGLFTIISQTWKAAIANPVKDLRRE